MFQRVEQNKKSEILLVIFFYQTYIKPLGKFDILTYSKCETPFTNHVHSLTTHFSFKRKHQPQTAFVEHVITTGYSR